MKTASNRLFFIDALRILGITLVVIEHVSSMNLYPWLSNYYPRFNVYNLYYIGYGTLGVSIFLFASGLSLALNYEDINTKERLFDFYKKRFLRIYPAYWLALLFSVIMIPDIVHASFSIVDLFKVVSGFQSFGATTAREFYGMVNFSLWFVSLILLLYLLAPIVIFAMKRRPHISIVVALLVATISSYYFGNDALFFRGIDWFPLARIFEFGLGIYLIRIGFYPKMQSSKALAYFGNLSFYIYLVHAPLLPLLISSQTLFLVAIFIMSSMFYAFDTLLHKFLEHVTEKTTQSPPEHLQACSGD